MTIEYFTILNLLNKKLETVEGTYSPVKVLHSNAGFYLGRTYVDKEGFQEPGSRESDYFRNQEDAQQALVEGFNWRDAPENVFMYEEYMKNIRT